MKMTDHDYQKEIAAPIEAFLSAYTEEQIKAARNNVPYVKDQFISFIWLIARKAGISFPFLYSLYNDDHIETALKKALKQYK